MPPLENVPDTVAKEGTTKESFSGPATVIDAAHSAADIKFGTRLGGWSRWIVEAITEKLQAENPELLKTFKALAGQTSDQERDELMAKVSTMIDDDPRARADLAKFVRTHRRKGRGGL